MKLAWWVGLVLSVRPGPAHAHSPVPGIDGFYTGIAHPFSTPEQAFLMLSLGLLVGSFNIHKVFWHLYAFFIATLIGMYLGIQSAQIDAVILATAFVACSWSALGPGKILPLAIVLVFIGGILIGMVSVPDPGPTRDRMVTMIGSFAGANIGLLYIGGMIQLLRERYTWGWVGIAFRIVAAWLGAISLIMLALKFAPSDVVLYCQPQLVHTFVPRADIRNSIRRSKQQSTTTQFVCQRMPCCRRISPIF